MDDLGMVTILLLVGVGFSLYLGSLALGIDIGTGFDEFISAVQVGDMMAIVNLIVTAISNPINLGLLGTLTGITVASSQSVRYTFAIAVLVGVSQILFMPFTIINKATAAVPVEIQLLIQGFFALLLLLAVMAFVMERRF